MPGISPFADDWRACLRAHYMFVARAQDKPTMESLTGVLHQVGFGEDELRGLYVRATQHVDDVPDDFMPDMTVLAAITAPDPIPEALIAAAVEAAAPENQVPPDATLDDPDAETETPEEPPVPFDPEGPQQLSMF